MRAVGTIEESLGFVDVRLDDPERVGLIASHLVACETPRELAALGKRMAKDVDIVGAKKPSLAGEPPNAGLSASDRNALRDLYRQVERALRCVR